ncbi:MAG: hypothetical protein VKJ24_12690 [Synechococcales bacterium]|nr:hypothetical protein [Synechococcales bacterium]
MASRQKRDRKAKSFDRVKPMTFKTLFTTGGNPLNDSISQPLKPIPKPSISLEQHPETTLSWDEYLLMPGLFTGSL